MKFVIHIGMGKTGTSSIQKRLSESEEVLGKQSACYLGMWFDMIDPKFAGLHNQLQFFEQNPAEIRAVGDALYRHMKERNRRYGIKTFIQSNESFSGKAVVLKPMLSRMIELGATVQIIGYVRNPSHWLPSAFVQWGVRHKMTPGRIRPYPEKARRLVRWYNGVMEWRKEFGSLLDLRSYDDAPDVVADFASAIGLTLPSSEERVLERAESAEVVLRALFNGQLKGAALPERFNRIVLPDLGRVPRLATVIADCLDYSATPKIIEENTEFFDQLEQACGFDPRQKGGPARTGEPNIDAVKDRLFDALVEIVLIQSQRIRRIEEVLERQSQGEAIAPGSFPPIRRP